MTNHQFMEAEMICPRTTMDNTYFAISAAFSAMNFRFSLLSRSIRADNIAADRQGQLFL